jgi:hypothetical protein
MIWPFSVDYLSRFGHAWSVIFWDLADIEIGFPGSGKRQYVPLIGQS